MSLRRGVLPMTQDSKESYVRKESSQGSFTRYQSWAHVLSSEPRWYILSQSKQPISLEKQESAVKHFNLATILFHD